MIAQLVESKSVNQPRSLSFTIPGRLGSWQRAGRNTAKHITFTPAAMRSDQVMVKQFAVLAMRKSCKTPLRGPLRLLVQTYRTVPKSWSVKKRAAATWITSKPDFDNTLKLIADALNKIAYDDDAQIADGRHLKRYANTDCVIVQLEELEDQ